MSATVTVKHGEVIEALRGYHFTYAREEDLRDAVALVLDAEFPHVPIERDVTLAVGSVDFVVGRVAVEVNAIGRAGDVLRRLEHHAGEEPIDALVLVTNHAERKVVRGWLGGKPLAILGLANPSTSEGDAP